MFPADFVENRCESKGNQTKAGQRIDNDTDIGQRRHRFAGDIFENILCCFFVTTALLRNRITHCIQFFTRNVGTVRTWRQRISIGSNRGFRAIATFIANNFNASLIFALAGTFNFRLIRFFFLHAVIKRLLTRLFFSFSCSFFCGRCSVYVFAVFGGCIGIGLRCIKIGLCRLQSVYITFIRIFLALFLKLVIFFLSLFQILIGIFLGFFRCFYRFFIFFFFSLFSCFVSFFWCLFRSFFSLCRCFLSIL